MAGAIVENLSGRKLTVLTVGLLLCQLVCFLVGGLIAPAPSNVQNILATKCLDRDVNKSQWFYRNGSCEVVDDLRSMDKPGSDSQIVYTFKLPLPRDGIELDYSRWMQNLIGVLYFDIAYDSQWEELEPKIPITVEARLGYRNKRDPPGDWKEYAPSSEDRELECTIEKEVPGHHYQCSLLPLFELGSLHHDFYLLNIRFPVYPNKQSNRALGPLEELWLVVINQNGGFTIVWVALKTVFFPCIIAAIVWFWRRVNLLSRPAALLEYCLFALGCALTLLNLPLEYLSLWIDIPSMLLINDIKQGIFYATLLSFWLVFAGEHLMDDAERNRLSSYWKNLSSVAFGCICMFIFDMCERGIQLSNPFFSIWATEIGTNIAITFVILAAISAGVYFLFLCYMIYRVFCNINAKRASIPAMSSSRRVFYEGVIYRFKFLMLATILCAAMTVIGFILGQLSEGKWKWDNNIKLEYTSAFFTGVYGMWNIYIFALLCLYAPSHKRWPPEPDSLSTGEEIEFTPLSPSSGAFFVFLQSSIEGSALDSGIPINRLHQPTLAHLTT